MNVLLKLKFPADCRVILEMRLETGPEVWWLHSLQSAPVSQCWGLARLDQLSRKEVFSSQFCQQSAVNTFLSHLTSDGDTFSQPGPRPGPGS